MGVVGTLVWDRIHRPAERSAPVEEWGGVAYALAAARVALPPEWTVVPIVKVGRDLAERAFAFLRGIPGMELSGVTVVPEPNNRVELVYRSGERRSEYLRGGVPPWTWPELAPLAGLCDALYVNFISGFEMDLPAARALRQGYGGPMWADLHSLFLGVADQGLRVPRTLEAWADWLRCFDAVQMNEAEFELLGGPDADSWHLAAGALGGELRLLAVTMGARGSAFVAAHDFTDDPRTWRRRPGVSAPGPARSGRVPTTEAVPEEDADPTGCGDVWGATAFGRMLGGASLADAMEAANRMAARNAAYRGASGLYHHLRGRLPGPTHSP